MSEPAIHVENLGKRYVLAHQASQGGKFRYERFSDKLIRAAKTPFRWLGGKPDAEAAATREEFWALKDVSFTIQQGDAVGIIGRNGAGKSTLLKVLSRITEPSHGRVELNGRVASLLEVGTGFHPELTGRENIYLNGAILGMSRAEIRNKFDEIVSFAEVEKFLDTPVKRYSSGMYVRLAFAVAAHLEPEILIVDEVLAVGDLEFQRKCLGKMQDVSAKDGRTVLFVSHNMNAVQRLCEKAVLLKKGGIEMQGETSHVIEAYLRSSQSRESAGGFTDLREAQRKISDLEKSAHFISIAMTNAKGKSATEVLFGESFVLSLGIEARARIPDAIIGFCIKASDGTPLMASHWDDHSGPRDLREGSLQVRCKVEPFLRPGLYYVDLGIVDSAFRPHDFIEDAFAFHVADVPMSTDIKLDRRPGNIALNLPWEIT